MTPKSKEELVEEFRIQTIQEAAVRVIARKGLAGASMQEIAAEAGIAKGTIYLYFHNQQELLEKTVDAALSRLVDSVHAALDGPGSFRERLERLLTTELEFVEKHQEFFRVLAATKYPVDRCARSERPQFKAFDQKLSEFLAQAMEEGVIRRMDPRRLALFVEEGCHAVLVQRLSELDSPPIAEDVEWMVNLILGGVSVREASK